MDQTPLKISNGVLGRFQAGDTVDPAFLPPLASQISATAASNLSPGQPVYVSAANTVEKADASVEATASVIGLAQAAITAAATGVIQTGGTLTLTTGQWDTVTGGSGGLTAGEVYYLSLTAGGLTTTAPSGVGEQAVLIGVALSTTVLQLQIGGGAAGLGSITLANIVGGVLPAGTPVRFNGDQTLTDTTRNQLIDLTSGFTVYAEPGSTARIQVGTEEILAVDATSATIVSDSISLSNDNALVEVSLTGISLQSYNGANIELVSDDNVDLSAASDVNIIASTGRVHLDGTHVDVGNTQIRSLANATADGHAVNFGQVKSHSETIGNGSATSITVTHNLNSREVAVTLRLTASPYTAYTVGWTSTTVNSVTLTFLTAPTHNQYTVTVTKGVL